MKASRAVLFTPRVRAPDTLRIRGRVDLRASLDPVTFMMMTVMTTPKVTTQNSIHMRINNLKLL